MNFNELATQWINSPPNHKQVADYFNSEYLQYPALVAHRKWIVDNKWGFGENCFHGVWYQLAKELPNQFSYCEVGVYRGQSLSAVDLAAQLLQKQCTVYGISSFDGFDGDYYEKRTNYDEDVIQLFERFNGDHRPVLIRGYSQDDKVKEEARLLAPFDAVYIDAQHLLESTRLDLQFYAPLVKVGGYLISDDSAVGYNLPNGFFAGFEGSSQACNEYFNNNNDWQFITNVVHMRIYQRLR